MKNSIIVAQNTNEVLDEQTVAENYLSCVQERRDSDNNIVREESLPPVYDAPSEIVPGNNTYYHFPREQDLYQVWYHDMHPSILFKKFLPDYYFFNICKVTVETCACITTNQAELETEKEIGTTKEKLAKANAELGALNNRLEDKGQKFSEKLNQWKLYDSHYEEMKKKEGDKEKDELDKTTNRHNEAAKEKEKPAKEKEKPATKRKEVTWEYLDDFTDKKIPQSAFENDEIWYVVQERKVTLLKDIGNGDFRVEYDNEIHIHGKKHFQKFDEKKHKNRSEKEQPMSDIGSSSEESENLDHTMETDYLQTKAGDQLGPNLPGMNENGQEENDSNMDHMRMDNERKEEEKKKKRKESKERFCTP